MPTLRILALLSCTLFSAFAYAQNCGYEQLPEDSQEQTHAALSSAALGATSDWTKGSERTMALAAAVKAGDSRLNSELTQALGDKNPLVRGMAGLVLIEGGKNSSEAQKALSQMVTSPKFNRQKWNNVTTSGSSDARIRIVDALLASGDTSSRARELLQLTIFGDPKDPAVLCTQLHVAGLLRQSDPPAVLVDTVKKGGRLAEDLPAPIKKQLERVEPNAMSKEDNSPEAKQNAENEKTVREINTKYSGQPGFEGAKVISGEVYVFFSSSRDSLRFPELHAHKDFYTSPKEVKWEFERLYTATSGYAGTEVNNKTREITLYFDRTRNWGNFVDSFGSWKVRTVFITPVEAERRRQSMHR